MDDANYNVAPPAYDDETAPAGATASPQPALFSFTDHKEKVRSMPNIELMTTRKITL